MKNNLLIILFLFISSLCRLYPQSGWQWQTPLPTGNTYRTIQFIDSLNGWIGGGGGSVLHTEDGGITWEVQWVGVHIYIQDLFFTDNNNGWVVGESIYGGPTYILHTSDGGITWEVQYENPGDYKFIAIDFIDSLEGWILHDRSSVMHTINGGLTWEEQTLQHFGIMKDIDFVDQNHGWATGARLYKTSNGGQDWEIVTIPDSLSWGSSLINFTDTLQGWKAGRRGILKTNDGGVIWEESYYDPEIICADISIVNEQVIWVLLQDGRLLKTDDGGITWTVKESDNDHRTRGIDFYLEDSGWVVGYFATLLSTTDDGVNWTNHTNMIGDFLTLMHYSVDFVDEHHGWVSGIRGSIYHTADGGLTWEEQSSGTDEQLFAIQFINSQKGWAAGDNGTVLKTIDGGNTWLDRSQDILLPFNDINFINDQTGWIAGGDYFDGGIVLHTNDGGDSWHVQISGTILYLDQVMFLDSQHGFVTGATETNFMMKTSDGGQTWESFTLPGGPSHFRSFFLDSLSGWIINEFGYVYHTVDAGQTWVLRAVEPAASDIIFIDENIGWVCNLFGIIYHTEDGGWTWTRQPSLTSNPLMSIDFIDSQTGWAVGGLAILHTETGGELKTKGISEINTINPESFTLYQNYPNPFNAFTLIPLDITAANTNGYLEVYNITGKLISILFKGEISAGQHAFNWDGRNRYGQQVSSGIYFIRFANESAMQSVKTVFIK